MKDGCVKRGQLTSEIVWLIGREVHRETMSGLGQTEKKIDPKALSGLGTISEVIRPKADMAFQIYIIPPRSLPKLSCPEFEFSDLE